ncbi:MAG: RDD family protein [Verrucomicrobiales bacterium]
MESGDRGYKRALKRQDFEVFRATARAPSLRRAIAAAIDLSVVAIPASLFYQITGSYFSAAIPLIYFLFRDYLFRSRSLGKLLTGLIVIDYATLSPITLRQCFIRNSIYAFFCPIIVVAGAAFSSAVAFLLPIGLLIGLASTIRVLSVIGYSEEDGTTIPDSWAETQVLTPGEVKSIIDFKNQVAGISE